VSQEPPDPSETRAEQLDDELAKKYDPERLLKIVSRRAGKGASLDHDIRAKYEKRFGVDLGHVRVYTGEFAEEFNRQRNAYAVTVGSTGMILMGGSPEKSMASASGQALLAHELTHVAQQSKGLHRKSTFSSGMPFAEEHEAEAEAVEAQVLAEQGGGGSAATSSSSTGAEIQAKGVGKGDQLKEKIEAVKARVLDLLGESARNQVLRNGLSRRA
jgi:hypothetical protein